MNWPTRNFVAAALSAIVFMVYIIFVTAHLPLGVSRAIVTAVLLVVIGLCSGRVMSGRLVTKLILLLAVPVIHIAYEGIDAAKPSLNLLVGGIEFLCLCIGATMGHFVRFRRRATTG